MKKAILVCVLGVTTLLAGCASPSPWADIPDEERQSWISMGFASDSAHHFRENGFTPAETREWVKAGIKSPQEITGWYRAGFSAHQALKWRMKGLSLQETIELTQ